MAGWRSSSKATTVLQDHPDLVRLGAKPGLWAYLRSIWQRRELAFTVPMGELKAQNMDSVLGAAWHLLNPLMLVFVYYIMFGVILEVEPRGGHSFIAFLAAGLFPFFYSRKSIAAGAKQIVANVSLIRSIKFPRAVLPISAVIGETVALIPAVAAMLVVIVLAGEPVRATWLLLIPIFVLQAMFNLGAALIVARVTDHFYDFQQLLPYLMQIWLYMSGVLYPVERFLESRPHLTPLFELNPAYDYITLVRGAVLDGATRGDIWLIATCWAFGTLIVGLLFFRAREQEYGRG